MTSSCPGISVAANLLVPQRESKLPQSIQISPARTTVQAGSNKLSGFTRLIEHLVVDNKSPKTIIDVVEETCGNLVKKLDEKIAALADTQQQRQVAIDDLLAISKSVVQEIDDHPARQGTVDLSAIDVTLPKNSPLRAAGKETASLVELMRYYRQEHPELHLPDVPQTASQLKAYVEDIGNAHKMSLEPGSQASYSVLQSAMQEKRAMQEMQAMLYRVIFDAFKKFIDRM